MPHDDEDEKEDEDMEDPDVRIQCKLAQIQAWSSAKVLIVGNPAQREREMREYSAIPNFQASPKLQRIAEFNQRQTERKGDTVSHRNSNEAIETSNNVQLASDRSLPRCQCSTV
jgi:hypothetical protein